jgi:hypothetical protein
MPPSLGSISANVVPSSEVVGHDSLGSDMSAPSGDSALSFQNALKLANEEYKSQTNDTAESGTLVSYLKRMDESFLKIRQDGFKAVEEMPFMSADERAIRNIDLAMRTSAININFQVAGQVVKSIKNSVQQLLKNQ